MEAFGDVYMLQGRNQLKQLRSSLQMKKVAFASQNRDVLYAIGSDLKVSVKTQNKTVMLFKGQSIEIFYCRLMFGFRSPKSRYDRWLSSTKTNAGHLHEAFPILFSRLTGEYVFFRILQPDNLSYWMVG